MPSLFRDTYLTCQTCHQRFLHTQNSLVENDELPTECPGCRALKRLIQRQTGQVVWYNRRRGFGFVQGQDARLAFVHVSDLAKRGGARLRQGARVCYRVASTPRGLRAVEVEILSQEPEPSR